MAAAVNDCKTFLVDEVNNYDDKRDDNKKDATHKNSWSPCTHERGAHAIFVVDRVLPRAIKHNNHRFYLVKWKHSNFMCCWVRSDHLAHKEPNFERLFFHYSRYRNDNNGNDDGEPTKLRSADNFCQENGNVLNDDVVNVLHECNVDIQMCENNNDIERNIKGIEINVVTKNDCKQDDENECGLLENSDARTTAKISSCMATVSTIDNDLCYQQLIDAHVSYTKCNHQRGAHRRLWPEAVLRKCIHQCKTYFLIKWRNVVDETCRACNSNLCCQKHTKQFSSCGCGYCCCCWIRRDHLMLSRKFVAAKLRRQIANLDDVEYRDEYANENNEDDNNLIASNCTSLVPYVEACAESQCNATNIVVAEKFYNCRSSRSEPISKSVCTKKYVETKANIAVVAFEEHFSKKQNPINNCDKVKRDLNKREERHINIDKIDDDDNSNVAVVLNSIKEHEHEAKNKLSINDNAISDENCGKCGDGANDCLSRMSNKNEEKNRVNNMADDVYDNKEKNKIYDKSDKNNIEMHKAYVNNNSEDECNKKSVNCKNDLQRQQLSEFRDDMKTCITSAAIFGDDVDMEIKSILNIDNKKHNENFTNERLIASQMTIMGAEKFGQNHVCVIHTDTDVERLMCNDCLNYNEVDSDYTIKNAIDDNNVINMNSIRKSVKIKLNAIDNNDGNNVNSSNSGSISRVQNTNRSTANNSTFAKSSISQGILKKASKPLSYKHSKRTGNGSKRGRRRRRVQQSLKETNTLIEDEEPEHRFFYQEEQRRRKRLKQFRQRRNIQTKRVTFNSPKSESNDDDEFKCTERKPVVVKRKRCLSTIVTHLTQLAESKNQNHKQSQQDKQFEQLQQREQRQLRNTRKAKDPLQFLKRREKTRHRASNRINLLANVRYDVQIDMILGAFSLQNEMCETSLDKYASQNFHNRATNQEEDCLCFLIKYADSNAATLVPASFINEKHPQILINFYEERMKWKCDIDVDHLRVS
ncbi:hypothetical protein B4U80_12713 [Leptotrombidium deliense]|uniref:Chromo shadow domain-containing protein n=1 Tax=Leptotrombidium deliense TaxID=299467 RepID=A0A443SQ41_9ACAR|nr:hypothetical protein B4U80_12713 [Leptotrombidium deliense]